MLSKKLNRPPKVPRGVLNAKYHEREASIVSQAGRKGAITISTNMAGRGTDIVLGGNPEAMAKDALLEEKSKLAESPVAAEPAVGEEGEGAEPPSGDSQGSPYRGSVVPSFDEDERYK